MVKQVLTVLVAHAALTGAHAEAHPPPPDDYDEPPPPTDDVAIATDEQPGFNMFGFDAAIGAQPRDGRNAVAMSLGLGVEHPVFKRTRVFGEYAWMWWQQRAGSERAGTAPRPDDDATGHRASLGLRRELAAKEGRTMRLFVDGELGGSIALVNDSMDGAELVPAGFFGLRAGYDLYSRRDSSPSRTFETAVFLRTIGTRDGVGVTFGLGMAWGN
jgi:hypothetical protein